MRGFTIHFLGDQRTARRKIEYMLDNYVAPVHRAHIKRQGFAKGTWGGTFHHDFQIQSGDILIKEHWNSSGFANTDLDYMLKQFAIERIVVIGMIANTCVECTGRFGTELGYHVTLVRDATAAYSQEAMHAAHDINGPSFAHAILTTDELVAAFSRA